MRGSAFLLSLLLICSLSSSSSDPPITPDSPPRSFLVSFSSPLSVSVSGLEPGAEYEAVAAWPSSQPALVSLSLLSPQASFSSRSLLNTEKLVFSPLRSSATLLLSATEEAVFSRASSLPRSSRVSLLLSVRLRHLGLSLPSWLVVAACLLSVAAAALIALRVNL